MCRLAAPRQRPVEAHQDRLLKVRLRTTHAIPVAACSRIAEATCLQPAGAAPRQRSVEAHQDQLLRVWLRTAHAIPVATCSRTAEEATCLQTAGVGPRQVPAELHRANLQQRNLRQRPAEANCLLRVRLLQSYHAGPMKRCSRTAEATCLQTAGAAPRQRPVAAHQDHLLSAWLRTSHAIPVAACSRTAEAMRLQTAEVDPRQGLVELQRRRRPAVVAHCLLRARLGRLRATQATTCSRTVEAVCQQTAEAALRPRPVEPHRPLWGRLRTAPAAPAATCSRTAQADRRQNAGPEARQRTVEPHFLPRV
mmetsp:Transcript_161186/g.517466  ORF Transcript_161186/g.517466 Transcript_161186/m.517466 type:complete len:308 (+) Transcript_161186:811-1734(+)